MNHFVILPRLTQNFLQFQNEQNEENLNPYLRKASLKFYNWMFLFFEPSLIQKKVLEGL